MPFHGPYFRVPLHFPLARNWPAPPSQRAKWPLVPHGPHPQLMTKMVKIAAAGVAAAGLLGGCAC